MNWVVVLKSEIKSMKELIILKHKLKTDSAATKFMQGSTSNQQLAVKSLAKIVRHDYMKNTQNRLSLNKNEFLLNKIPNL